MKPSSLRNFFFGIFFYGITFLYAVVAVFLSLLPGRGVMMASIKRYTKVIRWGLRVIARVKVDVAGREHIPEGVCIIASKHLSYADGHVIFSEFDDLSFVTGDHLLKLPLLGRILNKMNAVVIDSCGGSDVRHEMGEQASRIREQGRHILIFPEGHLSKIGTHHRYRKGVWHLYNDFDCPVIPVASNLGQRWNQTDWEKFPGSATVEFLEPIPPGMEKDAFMTLLQDKIETRSIALLDLDNPGALNTDDIGQLRENESAVAKRLAREAAEQGGPT
jgi:1-acyl-sn-glycerol-3-phosphate acyltransferase